MWSRGRGSGPRQPPVGWGLRGLWQTPSTRGQCVLTPSSFMSKTALFDWSSPKSQGPKQRFVFILLLWPSCDRLFTKMVFHTPIVFGFIFIHKYSGLINMNRNKFIPNSLTFT